MVQEQGQGQHRKLHQKHLRATKAHQFLHREHPVAEAMEVEDMVMEKLRVRGVLWVAFKVVEGVAGIHCPERPGL